MLKNIIAIGRNGTAQTFEVTIEEDLEEGYPYYCFQIKHPEIKTTKYFIFEVARIFPGTMMILNVNNFGVPEYSEKGIVKAIIKAVSKEFNCDIVSASNTNSKISVDDGRLPSVTSYWQKWCGEISNVSYIKEEDRFIYKKI